MAHILVVDDEPILVKGIKFNLEGEGHTVVTCFDGQAAVEQAGKEQFDLIMLDLMMPKMDGLEACMAIRNFSNVPIIMLTARGEDQDKLMGFEYGADDYITKPFHVLELKARVRALIRRSKIAIKQEEPDQSTILLGHISLDTLSQQVTQQGNPVELTAKEFSLMELLMKNPKRVYSRDNLLSIVWGYDYYGDDRTVDVHIRRLREKLELNPASPQYIRTKWGVGYFLEPPEEG
ncbi:MAG: response regulator transcription factor [Eubacteriales bacterium]